MGFFCRRLAPLPALGADILASGPNGVNPNRLAVPFRAGSPAGLQNIHRRLN
jgi:hypothetical protein